MLTQTENSASSLAQLIILLLDKTTNQIKNLSRLLANVQREETKVAIGITREWFQITKTTLVTQFQHHHQLQNQEQLVPLVEPIQVLTIQHSSQQEQQEHQLVHQQLQQQQQLEQLPQQQMLQLMHQQLQQPTQQQQLQPMHPQPPQ